MYCVPRITPRITTPESPESPRINVNGGDNRWEAAYKSVAGGVTRYYGGGAGVFFPTVQELMNLEIDFTYWRHGGVGTGPWSAPCYGPPWGPGPYPEKQWKKKK
jgi:hypothetical protein